MIYLILIVALFLRLINLNQSLWFDEAINIVYAQKFNFWDFVTKYPLGDFHPPLWFGILWIWTHIFGYSEVAVRILPVIFGVLTVAFTFFIGKKISREVGLMSSAFLAVAPLHIYYSQEARPYSLASFVVSLSFYFFIQLLRKNNWYFFIGYFISSTLVLYTDYVAYFVFPAQFIYLLIHQRKNVKKFLFGISLSVVVFSPWLLVFGHQFIQGITTATQITGWKEVVGGVKVKEIVLLWVKSLVGRVAFGGELLYAIFTSLISANYLFVLYKARKKILELDYIFLWLVVPPTSAFLISFFIPVFSYFRFIFILPAFYLLLAFGLVQLNPKFRNILFGGLLTVQVFFSFLYLLDPKFHREDWKSSVKFIEQSVSNNPLVLFENSEIPAPFLYYQKSSNLISPGLAKIPTYLPKDVNEIDTESSTIYLFEYLVEITDPYRLLEKRILSLGYRKGLTYNFRGVGFIHLYEK